MSDDKVHDLTTSILVEIRDELRGHRGILKEHSAILKEHSAILQEHSTILQEHGHRLGHLEQAFADQGITLKQILRAIERGTEIRDKQVADHEVRIAKIEDRLGIE